MHWLAPTTPLVTIYFAIGVIIRLIMVPVMLRRQFTPGASLAWLGIIFLHPYIGLGFYLLVGESWLGRGRTARHRMLTEKYRGPALQAGAMQEPAAACVTLSCNPIILQASKIGRMPIVCGNEVEFVGTSTEMVARLIADIDSATIEVYLLYYIIGSDETGEQIASALIAAAKRGVTCKVLADAFGSRRIFRGEGIAAKLRNAGIEVVAALPSNPLRRRDLREHRKLAILDAKIAWCGSHNLINADYGGRRGGPWVDLTGRFTGPVVGELAIVFAEDWAFETGRELIAPRPQDSGNNAAAIPMQVVPTGPGDPAESYRRLFLGAVQIASRELTLTTPYFVPDDPTLLALMMAADRGVEVTLILPQTSDSHLSAMAGRSHYDVLLNAGVRIFLYRPGLIHAKTLTVDDTVAIIGSANLDVRSFNLNFELSVVIYGPEATRRLRAVQQQYIADAVSLDQQSWSKRPVLDRYMDRAVSLLSPLL